MNIWGCSYNSIWQCTLQILWLPLKKISLSLLMQQFVFNHLNAKATPPQIQSCLQSAYHFWAFVLSQRDKAIEALTKHDLRCTKFLKWFPKFTPLWTVKKKKPPYINQLLLGKPSIIKQPPEISVSSQKVYFLLVI